MTASDVNVILKELPKNTPAWAVGAVSIVVSFVLCLGSMYVVIRPDVQSYLAEGYKIQDKKAEVDSSVTSSILSIIKSNAEQISSLSSSLALSQADNTRLAARVDILEKELSITKSTLQQYDERFKELRRTK